MKTVPAYTNGQGPHGVFAELRLAARDGAQRAVPDGTRRRRPGERLVADGLITPDQLARALEIHRATGERLGRVLLDMRAVDQERLTRLLSEQLGVKFVRVIGTPLREELLTLLPPRWPAGCRRFPLPVIAEMTDELRHLVITRAPHHTLKAGAEGSGMTTLLSDGLQKAAAGVTSLAEVWRVVHVERATSPNDAVGQSGSRALAEQAVGSRG